MRAVYIKNNDRQKKKYDNIVTKQLQELDTIFNEKWFVNKTDTDIPNDIQWLLSLGPKHAIPTENKEIPIFILIADGEDCIQTIRGKEELEMARTKLSNIIDNFNNRRSTDIREKHMISTVGWTKSFLQRNKNIVILSADKGNVTVAMERED